MVARHRAYCSRIENRLTTMIRSAYYAATGSVRFTHFAVRIHYRSRVGASEKAKCGAEKCKSLGPLEDSDPHEIWRDSY
jgi:hypothetical protein